MKHSAMLRVARGSAHVMKAILAALLTLTACTPAGAQESVEMPQAFRGEWCGDGGTCPDGWTTVTKGGFIGISGVRCDLRKASFRSSSDVSYRARGGFWQLTFKCTDSDKLVEETWFFLAHRDTVLVVMFWLPEGRMRFVQYLPRTRKDRG